MITTTNESRGSIRRWGPVALHHLVKLYLEPEGLGLLVEHQQMRLMHSNIRLAKANLGILLLLQTLMGDSGLGGLMLAGTAKPFIFLRVMMVFALRHKLLLYILLLLN
ncbi:uncharacterized protein HD556DRAFT_1314573 [Suillus plorans]|uniref:Uncharacterized protein n=1 Tax=Suillus plorans TaxID=116603 RepID=A0A9P7DAI4_9AGAM|nr:uncharacterized protein HD556DRAFT_1314573 [Suillus plorans]KAG1785027.1 hypothetical protein HD556DRAFT_1314573 [Suillus plorans]